MRHHSRIAHLTARRISLTLQAALLTLAIRALFMAPMPVAWRVLTAWLKGWSPDCPACAGRSGEHAAADEALFSDVAYAVAFAGRRVAGSRCLDQALVAKTLLGRCGRGSTLRVGVATGPSGSLAGHAWIEADGRVVVGGNPAKLAQYRLLPETLTPVQQIGFFLALQKNSGARARDRAPMTGT